MGYNVACSNTDTIKITQLFFFKYTSDSEKNMSISDLPTLNAIMNTTSLVLLVLGFYFAKRKEVSKHRKCMLLALCTSVVFLTSYLVYHSKVGSVPYPFYDWTRLLYFSILIPHIILAGVIVPFIITALVFALKKNFERHRKIVRWVWPSWIFVSISGVVVYGMLYLQ